MSLPDRSGCGKTLPLTYLPVLQQDPVTVKREEPLTRERLDPASGHAELQLVFDLVGREFQSDRIALVGPIEEEADTVIAIG